MVLLNIATDSIKGLLLLFLAILANFLGKTLNCKTQDFLNNSAIGRNIVVYFLIYFTINFTTLHMHPIKEFVLAFFIYVLYVLLMKQTQYFFLINLFIIFIIFVNAQIKDFHKIDKEKTTSLPLKESIEKDIQNADKRNKTLLTILPITLIIGFILYFIKQSNEQKDFNILTFLFGSNQCESI